MISAGTILVVDDTHASLKLLTDILRAERLLVAIEAHPFEASGMLFRLSLSIGLIEIDGKFTAGELLSQADAAMYRAKAQGKNRVVVA